MSERWKPGFEETFYCIFNDGCIVENHWWNSIFDKKAFELGNCFKTEAEAKAAAEKVKALLLNLHCDETLQANDETLQQLPKLTAEVFNHPDCPEWAKWAAVDGNGEAFYYSEKPSLLPDEWGWGSFPSISSRSEVITGSFSHINWSDSLIERPAELPDWCKHNALCYDGKEYLRIFMDENNSICAYPVGGGTVKAYEISEITEARLRPYNADEMRALVGKVVEDNHDAHLVIGFIKPDPTENLSCFVRAGQCWNTAEKILEDYTINGKPAGVLEHLKNGEWVQ